MKRSRTYVESIQSPFAKQDRRIDQPGLSIDWWTEITQAGSSGPVALTVTGSNTDVWPLFGCLENTMLLLCILPWLNTGGGGPQWDVVQG